MTFLPIVARELRVASRKRSTFWLRVIAALVGLILGGAFLSLPSMVFGLVGMGKILFGVLTWMAVIAAFATGVFFTSDCLSEEKRDGTLGFLFLTDLRGYDVVLGKLLAASLRALSGLLAIVPIFAVTWLMGGVTGVQLWKTSLALVNALFGSLAWGLLASALGRDSQRVMGGTLGLLLLLVLGGPLVDTILASAHGRGFVPYASLISSGYAFVSAGAWGHSPFWLSLALSHALGWAAIALACLLVPRAWQERAKKKAGLAAGWAYHWKYGGFERRRRLRVKLLGLNPVLWLACRERWQAFGIWLITLILSVITIWALVQLPGQMWFGWTYLGWIFTMFLYLWAASQACRFFAEAKRSGLVELLLASPLDERAIVRGQWSGHLRMFGVPILLLLSIHVVGMVMGQGSWRSLVVQPGGSSGPAWLPEVTLLVSAVTTAVSTLANLLALAWFGMWMGMTSRSATFATLKTFLFVHVIPVFIIGYASFMVIPLLLLPQLRGGSGPPAWSMSLYPLAISVTAGALSIIKDLAFILWSRKKLYFSFREQAAQGAGSVRISLPAPPPPGALVPPLIVAQP